MTRAPPLRPPVPDFGRHAPKSRSPAASTTQAARAAFFGYRFPCTVSLILNTPAFGLEGTSRSSFKICASIAQLVPTGEALAETSRRAGWPRGSVLCDAIGAEGAARRPPAQSKFRRVDDEEQS